MKAGRLIEVLKQVSPDTEVTCGVTIEDTPTLFTINLFDLERVQKYEVKSVLTKPDDDKYGVFSKLTLTGKTYMLRPEDILLFNEAKELTHVLQNPTLQTLLHNGFHGRVLNDGA